MYVNGVIGLNGIKSDQQEPNGGDTGLLMDCWWSIDSCGCMDTQHVRGTCRRAWCDAIINISYVNVYYYLQAASAPSKIMELSWSHSPATLDQRDCLVELDQYWWSKLRNMYGYSMYCSTYSMSWSNFLQGVKLNRLTPLPNNYSSLSWFNLLLRSTLTSKLNIKLNTKLANVLLGHCFILLKHLDTMNIGVKYLENFELGRIGKIK